MKERKSYQEGRFMDSITKSWLIRRSERIWNRMLFYPFFVKKVSFPMRVKNLYTFLRDPMNLFMTVKNIYLIRETVSISIQSFPIVAQVSEGQKPKSWLSCIP